MGNRPVEIPADWRNETVLSVLVACAILGITSRSAAYRAVSKGWVPSIQLGSRRVVPVAKLRRLLGELPDESVEAAS
jgi:hypothetical protein